MKKKLAWIFSTLSIIIVAYVVTKKIDEKSIQEQTSELLESPGFTSGYFEELRFEKGKTTIGIYSYQVAGIPLKGKKGDGRLRKIGKDIYENPFPVIYNVNNPAQSVILIFPSDFVRFKRSYPDSLNWVKKILE